MEAPTTIAPLAVGARAPHFRELPGVDGKRHSMDSFADARLIAVVFIASGCPTVRAYEDRLATLTRKFGPLGVQLIAINSNNPHLSPGDALPEMARRSAQGPLPFPYLKDENGSVGRAFGAVCTPHAFLLDEDRTLRYRGRVDDARLPDNVTSHDLDQAIQDVLNGRAPSVPETEPFGCSIVW